MSGPAKGADSLKSHRNEIDFLKEEVRRLNKALEAEMPSKLHVGQIATRADDNKEQIGALQAKMKEGAGDALLRRIRALEEGSKGPFHNMEINEIAAFITLCMAAAAAPKGISMNEKFIFERLETNMKVWDIFRASLDGTPPPWEQEEILRRAQREAAEAEAKKRIENVEHGSGKTEEERVEEEREPVTAGAPLSKQDQALAAAGIGRIGKGPPKPPGGGRQYGE